MRPEGAKEATYTRLHSAAETAARFRATAGGNFPGDTLSALRFGVHVFLVRVLVDMLHFWRCRRTFRFLLRYARRFRWCDLLAAIHTRHLVEVVREAEIAALFILDHLRRGERMMRPAIAGVTLGMAHSN